VSLVYRKGKFLLKYLHKCILLKVYLKSMTSIIIILEIIEAIKINILYHLNKKKVNGGRLEILIIMYKIISLLGVVKLIHEEKLDEE